MYTVKTIRKAEELLAEAYRLECIISFCNPDFEIIRTSGRCQCGETLALKVICEDVIYKINVCPSCGSDDAFIEDVLNIF